MKPVLLSVLVALAYVVALALGGRESADLLGGAARSDVISLALGATTIVLHLATWVVAPILAIAGVLDLLLKRAA